jgi:hypothetical protein
VNASFNISLVPFLPPLFRFLKLCDALLQICLSRLNRNILHILAHLFLYKMGLRVLNFEKTFTNNGVEG